MSSLEVGIDEPVLKLHGPRNAKSYIMMLSAQSDIVQGFFCTISLKNN